MTKQWPNSSSDFLKLTGIEIPIVQAPMAGGPSSPELVSAVSMAGGLGSLGGGYLSPEALEGQILSVKSKTDKPFCVNLFVTDPGEKNKEPGAEIRKMLDKYADELGVELTGEIVPFPDFDTQFEVVIEYGVKVFSFTFGVLQKKYFDELKRNKIFTIGTATSVKEAQILEKSGCDAVVAQGYEAGGHRGSFEYSNGLPLIGGITLIPQIADKVDLPVIASGGIMDGRGICAALSLGASAVQMGTAFLTCEEAGVNQSWIDLLLGSKDTSTVVTNAYTGKYARGFRTRFTSEMKKYEDEIPEYPSQHQLTRELRSKAKDLNNKDFMAFWAGQGSPMSRKTYAADLIRQLISEYEDVFLRMNR